MITARCDLAIGAYRGYVTGLRDQSREIRGRHEPIVPEELFGRIDTRGSRPPVRRYI